jgi:hypothetical protein
MHLIGQSPRASLMSVSPSAYFSTEIPGVVATGGADAFVAVAGLDMPH